MYIFEVQRIQDDLPILGVGMGFTSNMPFAEFGSTHLNSFPTISQCCLFNIRTDTAILQFKFDPFEKRLHYLVEDEFNQAGRTMIDLWSAKIYCASCK